MRLLRVATLALETFVDERKRPEYAILSHTWGDDEVLFDDIQRGTDHARGKKGFRKVQDACLQAEQDGYKYIWIDTCCIDKSSSAELSEAINSMFKWYQDSSLCYAYLEDMDTKMSTSGPPSPQFDESRWFTRGWTLQELIAPSIVRFYDKKWSLLGDRQSLGEHIANITGIDNTVLVRNHEIQHERLLKYNLSSRCYTCGELKSVDLILETFSVATRMSWAASRQTTRREDQAYCLMGLFGVNMPLLYGEGTRAFTRLQEEIITVTNDQSIFAFMNSVPDAHFSTDRRFLANSPTLYRDKLYPAPQPTSMTLSAGELTLELFLCPCSISSAWRPRVLRVTMGILNCNAEDGLSRPAILLRAVDAQNDVYARIERDTLLYVGPDSEPYARTRNEWEKLKVTCDIREATKKRIRLVAFNDISIAISVPATVITEFIAPKNDSWKIEFSYPVLQSTDGFTVHIPPLIDVIARSPIGTMSALVLVNESCTTERFVILWETMSSSTDPNRVPWCHTESLQQGHRSDEVSGDIRLRLEALHASINLPAQEDILKRVRKNQGAGSNEALFNSQFSSCDINGRNVHVEIREVKFLDILKLELSVSIQGSNLINVKLRV